MHLSRIPSGLRYYIGAAARLRRTVEDCAISVFDGWSYEEIVTPTVDYYSLFAQGMGAEAHRALRLCYAAPVFRQRPQSHAEWRRESTQLGCELIGAGSSHADLEVLVITAEILKRLGLDGGFRITLNSVEVFNGIAEELALDGDARERMRSLIDVRDAASLRQFLDTFGAGLKDRDVFARLTQLSGKREILDQGRAAMTNPRSVAALDALEHLWVVIESLGLSDSFEIDLGDVSGLDYYTGLVFKIYIRGAGVRVGRGGRYDRLTASVGRAEPAIGLVLDLVSLTELLSRP